MDTNTKAEHGPPGYGQPYAAQQGQQYPGQPVQPHGSGPTVVVMTQQVERTPLPCSYIVGLIFSILSCLYSVIMVWLGICCAIPAIVLASLSVGTHGTQPDKARTYCKAGMGLTIVAFLTGTIILIVVIVVWGSAFAIYGSSISSNNNQFNFN